MMTPKERAEELVRKFAYEIREDEDKEGFISNIEHAKAHAILMCQKIIDLADKNEIVYSEFKDNTLSDYTEDFYWNEVKKEIELL